MIIRIALSGCCGSMEREDAENRFGKKGGEIMFLIFVICMVGASVCANIVNTTAKDGTKLEKEGKSLVTILALLGMTLGFFLMQYGQFSIEFYGNLDLDFLDYGKITGEGWLYILMRVAGLVAVAENILAIVNVFVQEIKQTISSKSE